MADLDQPLHETTYEDKDLTGIHINLPTQLWRAVGGLARFLGTTKTNIAVRALDNYAYLTQVLVADDDTKVVIEHGNGTREYVPFPELSRAKAAETATRSHSASAALHAR